MNFVLYGKQTHAKGPIGSRPVVPSTFPRLSDYVASMSRSSVGTAGNSHVILSNMKSNSSFNPFFDALNDAKRIVQSRKAEEEGNASYVVTKAHAAFHRRIVEDRIDNMDHVFSTMRMDQDTTGKTRSGKNSLFDLCPVIILLGNSLTLRFIWSSEQSLDDGTLLTYIESILCNSQPPLSEGERHTLARKVIATDVLAQIVFFKRVNDKYREIVNQFSSLMEGIKFIHQQTPHMVHTRKSNPTQSLHQGTSPISTTIDIEIAENWKISWDVFTPDVLTLDYVREMESNQDLISASDLLFNILDNSVRHRASLLHISSAMQKRQSAIKSQINEESPQYDEDQIREMDAKFEHFKDGIIAHLRGLARFKGSPP